MPDAPWQYGKGYTRAEFHMHTAPGAVGAGGFIKAINVRDGKAAWTKKFEEPIWAGHARHRRGPDLGITTTSRDFMALNAETGDTLWNFRNNSGIVAAPITYELDGVQYVAIV